MWSSFILDHCKDSTNRYLVVCTVRHIELQYQGSTAGGSLRGAATKSCCESLCGDLLQTLIASRSTSTVFCPKIFWFVIRNAFRNRVSNWKCWKVWLAAAAAKKRFWRSSNSRSVYGARPHASNTVVSNSRSSNHDADIGPTSTSLLVEQSKGMWQITIPQSHTASKTNSKCNVEGLGAKKGSPMGREAEICWNTHSLRLFTGRPALKTPRQAAYLNRTMDICKIYYCRNSLVVSNAIIIESPLDFHPIVCIIITSPPQDNENLTQSMRFQTIIEFTEL